MICMAHQRAALHKSSGDPNVSAPAYGFANNRVRRRPRHIGADRAGFVAGVWPIGTERELLDGAPDGRPVQQGLRGIRYAVGLVVHGPPRMITARGCEESGQKPRQRYLCCSAAALSCTSHTARLSPGAAVAGKLRASPSLAKLRVRDVLDDPSADVAVGFEQIEADACSAALRVWTPPQVVAAAGLP